MIVWCEQRECYHNVTGRCALHGIKLVPTTRGGDTLICATYKQEEEIELPSVSLQESMACDEHNGRFPYDKEIDDG